MLCQTKGISIFLHTFGCPHMSGYLLYVWIPSHMFRWPNMFGQPYICLDAPCMFGHPPYLWTPPYVWMPPVHKQHKESILCQTKGMSICLHTFGCPHMSGCPLYVWIPPVCSDGPICLDTLTYVWMPPVCLDIPHMFGCPLYVLMMFGCPLYIHNTKMHALSD